MLNLYSKLILRMIQRASILMQTVDAAGQLRFIQQIREQIEDLKEEMKDITREEHEVLEEVENLLVQLQGQVDTKDGYLYECTLPIKINGGERRRSRPGTKSTTSAAMEAISDNDNGGKVDNSSGPLYVARQKEIAYKNSYNVQGRSYVEQLFMSRFINEIAYLI